MAPVLALFHPVIREWFEEAVGRPTPVQEAAWPKIARGEHLLATAPTGSGKTLTAFLWALNQLASGAWEPGTCRVLYISPLKALNNDIRRNLLRPLEEIRNRFEAAGLHFPDIKVLTRSGDTPQEDRRKMIRRPPEILITTPESLNLLLSSPSGITLLGNLTTVILDEIHACAASRRGVHLMTAVDRLVRLSGEFQRIALSATLKDEAPILELVGGYRMSGTSRAPEYRPRKVGFIRAGGEKETRIRICFPERPKPETEGPDIEAEDRETVWDLLAQSFVPRIEKNRSTLIFTNGRRLCEKLAWKINQAAGSLVAFSHHGSLSRELRRDVEQKLKKGALRAIVATSSLEMGIDIGSLDEVIMVQAPPSVSAMVQRTGRSGHGVGLISRGTLFPAHVQDLIPSAVLARAAAARDIEPLKPVSCPLDVLAQILVSMTGTETWDLDDLFAFVRTSAPYHHLSRERFDLVVQMLAGRYAGTRIRELVPRVSIDRLENTIRAGRGALLSLYMSGGTIPDRGYFQLRDARTGVRIGELDEEYVWEAKTGQIATIGSRNWQITRITHNDVFALPAGNRGMDAPFWIAEGMNRDAHFSRQISEFLAMVQTRLDRGEAGEADLTEYLRDNCFMDRTGAGALVDFCRRQAREAALPHARRLVLEFVWSGPDGSPGTMLVIHTLWGGRVNRPFALALAGAWEQAFGEAPEVFPGNDAVVVQLPGPVDPAAVMALVRPDNFETLVRSRLESSGFFGARFRECAGRALLITRNRINQRMPLWMTRLKSQKLMENILAFPDFPILLETWRTCLEDEFDLPALAAVLEEIDRGRTAWTAVQTARPSPFASALAWQQINQYMYQQDQPASKASGLSPDLIREALYNEALRPAMPRALIRAFENKRRRLARGYAPETPEALLDWVKERLALPMDEWEELIQASGLKSNPVSGLAADVEKTDRAGENSTASEADGLPWLSARLVMLRPPGAEKPLVVALEAAEVLVRAWYPGSSRPWVLDLQGEPLTGPLPVLDEEVSDGETGTLFLGQWLGFYGPVRKEDVTSRLGLAPDLAEEFLSDLIEERALVAGDLVLGETGGFLCDARNFETLMRMNRAGARPETEPLDLKLLPLFLARTQGLTRPGDNQDHVFDNLAQLSCLPLKAGLWESQVLPARVQPYYPAFLDSLMQEGDLVWLGREKEEVLFCLAPDLAFLGAEEKDKDPGIDNAPETEDLLAPCFEAPGVRHRFEDLTAMAGAGSETGAGRAALYRAVWERVWQGRLTCDSFVPVRRGLEKGFDLYEAAGAGPSVPNERWAGIRGQGTQGLGTAGRRAAGRFRSRPARLRSGNSAGRTRPGSRDNPMPGHWFVPETGEVRDIDLVDREELKREKARLLLDRYGILFRELLARELPGFRWANLFRSLYLMELSGEVVTGSFFKGIEGLQFASHKALRELSALEDRESVFWITAADPASACGLGALSSELDLPRRLPGNLMVYKGADLRLVSLRQGREILIHAAPEDPDLPRYLAPLEAMVIRQAGPVTKISIETINGEDAASSPYRHGFEGIFEVVGGPRTLDLFRKMR